MGVGYLKLSNQVTVTNLIGQFFGYVSSRKMSQSVPGGYKYTRVVFEIVSVLNKIKMSRKSKTTVKGLRGTINT